MVFAKRRHCSGIERGASALLYFIAGAWMAVLPAFAEEAAVAPADPAPGNPAPVTTTNKEALPETKEQLWNWHMQNTAILDWHPGFPAQYSGPNSMRSDSEVQETVSLDLLVGARLWRGAEFHVDGLLWQGYGFSHTVGAEGFPNGEAFRTGTTPPNVNISRLFVRQDIGLGGDQETVEDEALYLAGKRDISRVTLTVGKMSVKDIFDNNTYANDPRTQFLNWAFIANEAWDFPADSLGYTTGAAAEWNEANWTARYGFFQMPRESNGTAQDQNYLQAWGMVAEFERRWAVSEHPGAVRFLAFLNRAHMGSYEEVVDNPALGGDITLTREYRYKYGFGLNLEQELTKGVGAFARLGWSDGQTEAWAFSDVDHAASFGLSIKGDFWGREGDTVGLAGALNGISDIHRQFFAVGGTGILAGDGTLTYAIEQVAEGYYDFQIWKTIHATVDYQFIANPAFNQDRGPISVVSGRVHWEF
jgi:high affinity Mn2+ porin